MKDEALVRYLGFQTKVSAREYSFQVHEAGADRQFTLSIANEAFLLRQARYQDGPDICAQKLQTELAAHANHPSQTEYVISHIELETYRVARTPKPNRYPARHSKVSSV